MKPPSRSDYQRSDATDPGAASESARADAANEPEPVEDEDEFPSEATRIDMRGAGGPGGAVPVRAAPARSSSSRPIDTRPQSNSNPPTNVHSSKLAALQSLSLDSASDSAARRLPPAPRGDGGGSSKLPWILLTLVVAGVGGNWAWQRYHVPTGGTTTTQTSVKTEIVHATGGSGSVHMASGFTAARAPIAINASVGGRIKDVKIQNGDKVKSGQVVVILDDSAIQGDLSVAGAELHEAERTLARTQSLYKNGAATLVELERARGAAEIARARLRPLSARLSQTRIKAQSDGTVLEVVAHVGEAVNATATIAKIADLSQLNAETDINESDLVKIRRGQQVVVTSDAVADKQFQGVVREIAEQADKARGTVQVKVELTVPDGSLRPGMSVKCAFQPEKGEKPRVFISKSSLTSQGGAWVVGADRRIAHRPLKTQLGNGGSVEVLEGLRGGEEIVVDAALVHEGQSLPLAPP